MTTSHKLVVSSMASDEKPARRFKHLPVVIEEDHNEVVPHIHRAIATRHLPLSGMSLVHLDSHPDLLIPVNMPAEFVFNKEMLYRSLSIENWILPLVFAGHINRIYWLRPPWAPQLPEGEMSFYVGMCRKSGKLRVTCTETYFLTEGLFAPQSQLINEKEVTLHVITITPDSWTGKMNSTKPVSMDEKSVHWSWLKDAQEKLSERPFLLDVDLDFFSTKDPFNDEFTAEQTALLRDLFGYTLPKKKNVGDLTEFTATRIDQLQELEKAFDQLQENQDSIPQLKDQKRQAVLEKLLSCLQSSSHQPVDFGMVYQAGCTMDDTDLPHHVSSPVQIKQLMDSCADILQQLSPPSFITVARSSSDDYCPQDQVEAIQASLISMLSDVYRDIEIKKLYEVSLTEHS